MTDTTQPPTPNSAAHPGLALLSGLVDDELAGEEVAVTRAHLLTCALCRRETEQLTTARTALASAPQPVAPPGSSDRAVAAALVITSPVAAEAAGKLAAIARETPTGRTGGGRRRRGVALRAAAALLLAGALGTGLVAVLRSDHSAGPLRAGPAETTSPKIAGGTLGPSSTVPQGGFGGPVIGAFELQLRTVTGPASCTKAVRHVATVGGVSVAVNPPAPERTVLRTAAGGPATCVAVGPAFATIWSGNVAAVSVGDVATPASSTAPAGAQAELVIRLAPGTLGGAALKTAETPGVSLAAVAAGSDIGGAHVGGGPVVTIQLSRAMALLVARGLA